MSRIVLFLIAKCIAFATGSGVLSQVWLIATLVVDYVLAIFKESYKAPHGDFRELSDNEFGKSESNIKMQTAKNLIVSAFFYGLGHLANYFEWL